MVAIGVGEQAHDRRGGPVGTDLAEDDSGVDADGFVGVAVCDGPLDAGGEGGDRHIAPAAEVFDELERRPLAPGFDPFAEPLDDLGCASKCGIGMVG